MRISIHAPARGATAPKQSVFMSMANFNPRSREGSDPLHKLAHYLWMQFQSTLPRGERQILQNNGIDSAYISIHAPARGATRVTQKYVKNKIFQSTLPRGERPNNVSIAVSCRIFQSTLPRGERR